MIIVLPLRFIKELKQLFILVQKQEQFCLENPILIFLLLREHWFLIGFVFILLLFVLNYFLSAVDGLQSNIQVSVLCQAELTRKLATMKPFQLVRA